MDVFALQKIFPNLKITLKPISGSDKFYSDGLADGYDYKIIIHNEDIAEYVGFLKNKECYTYLINSIHAVECEKIIKEWIGRVTI